jgi:hypothetical protein
MPQDGMTNHLLSYQEGERRAHGFDFKMLQTSEEGAEDIARVREIVENLIEMRGDQIELDGQMITVSVE